MKKYVFKVGDVVLVGRSNKANYTTDEFPIDFEGKRGIITIINDDPFPYKIKFDNELSEFFVEEELTLLKHKKSLNGD